MIHSDTADNPAGLRRFASRCIARPLVSTRVMPGHLRAGRIATALVAALVLAIGPPGFRPAAALLLLALLLERSGSQLARERGNVSTSSERHALLYNSASHILVFTGLGVGLMGSDYGSAALGMGLLAGLGVAAVPWMVHRLAALDGKPSDEFGGFAGLEADDVLMLAVPAALWAGWAEGLLFLTACAAPTFAVAFFLTHYRKFSASW